jgi:hypothetical protein
VQAISIGTLTLTSFESDSCHDWWSPSCRPRLYLCPSSLLQAYALRQRSGKATDDDDGEESKSDFGYVCRGGEERETGFGCASGSRMANDAVRKKLLVSLWNEAVLESR